MNKYMVNVEENGYLFNQKNISFFKQILMDFKN